ncbi:plantaricin C family lantibiotic [Priestia megaterium]|uniref:plantaricin C family lantibiotic n=1 Tax=Priestia megaterium TaxID=1404 RepID=UPI00077D6FF4|nr:plantaricin C family lantibiotic [Priestia megaterium]
MEKFLKNPVLQSKHSLDVENPSGNLFEEISEQDMSAMAGGTNDWASKQAANLTGLGNNYGRVCTLSAECNGTDPCGGTK